MPSLSYTRACTAAGLGIGAFMGLARYVYYGKVVQGRVGQLLAPGRRVKVPPPPQ